MPEFNFNYMWAAIAINVALVYIVPKLIKKPTGFKPLDDVVLYLNSQKGFIVASSIVIALIVYGAHSWVDVPPNAAVAVVPCPPRPKKF